MALETCLHDFLTKCDASNFYSEATLQLELAIHLRKMLPKSAVHLERPIDHFGGCKMATHEKREIDICVLSNELMGGWSRKNQVFSDANSFACSIELKFPKSGNGRVPETCYDFCKDVLFAERMLGLGFHQAFAIMLTNNHLFYRGRKAQGVYSFFRHESPLTGRIPKPTGQLGSPITISGEYRLKWLDASNGYKFLLVEAKRT